MVGAGLKTFVGGWHRVRADRLHPHPWPLPSRGRETQGPRAAERELDGATRPGTLGAALGLPSSLREGIEGGGSGGWTGVEFAERPEPPPLTPPLKGRETQEPRALGRADRFGGCRHAVSRATDRLHPHP